MSQSEVENDRAFINITKLVVNSDVQELLLQESYASSSNPSENNGSLITLIVGTLPIITLCLIILGFKICYKLCPQGQRAEFHIPRRISTFSSFSAMSRTSSMNQMGHPGCNTSQLPQGASHHGSGSHLNLHHVHHYHFHNIPPTVRADGTPLVSIELETITDEPEFEDDEPGEGPLSFTASTSSTK